MRLLITVLFLLTSFQALALSVYNCDVTAISKRSALPSPWTKKIFLSPAFTNKVSFSETLLELSVDRSEVIHGLVNGQPNFKLSGTTSRGSFESAYHTGEIYCDPAKEVSYLFRFNSWKQFFTLDSKLSQGHILKSIELGQLKYGLVCFIGDVAKAEASASVILKTKGVIKSPYEISYKWTDEVCARGHGYSNDDWVCDSYKLEQRTDSIPHCFESEYDRP